MSRPKPLCGELAGFILVRFLVFWIIANRFPNHRTAWTPRPEYSRDDADVKARMDIALNLWSEGEHDLDKISRTTKLSIEQVRRAITIVQPA